MKSLKRAIPFLILNIIISAATTLAVLNWFGGGLHLNQQPEPSVPAAVLNSSPTQAAVVQPIQPAATLAADASGRVIEIQTVIGPGDLNNESVGLRRLGSGDLSMAGWYLDDGNGHRFVFPDFVLNKDGAVQVSTRPGTNSAIALFWALQAPVWTPGTTVNLYDATGKLQAMYTVK